MDFIFTLSGLVLGYLNNVVQNYTLVLVIIIKTIYHLLLTIALQKIFKISSFLIKVNF